MLDQSGRGTSGQRVLLRGLSALLKQPRVRLQDLHCGRLVGDDSALRGGLRLQQRRGARIRDQLPLHAPAGLHRGLRHLPPLPHHRHRGVHSLQEVPLHPKLHPRQPLLLLRPEGQRRLRQGRGAVCRRDAGPLLHFLGLPSSVLILWVLTRALYDDRGCWDDTDSVGIWWIIKGPITASLLVSVAAQEPRVRVGPMFPRLIFTDWRLSLQINIVIFVNVIRILVQKLKSSAINGNNDSGHFIRLAKSTLFLIPLFGMHYTVFAFLPENTGVAARLYIELGLGSFQGFVVALLYCFMNGEVRPACTGIKRGADGAVVPAARSAPQVQAELRRWFWRCHSQNQLSPTKRSITQTTTVRGRGGLRRPPSSGQLSSV
ncbi:uncharacterized protein ACB058_014912 isoform 5-T5 [Synchiropus picturatus]